MKQYSILLIVCTFTLIGCKSEYSTVHNSKIIVDNNLNYLINDSLHLTCEIESNNNLTDSTKVPLEFNKIQRYILKLLKVNTHKDAILYSDSRQLIVFRKTSPKLEDFRAYSVFDTTIYKELPNNTLKKFYRKTHSIERQKLYIIEDVFQTQTGYYSFIYFGQNETKGGSWFIDPTDPDDVLFYVDFYKHTLNVMKKNAVKIMLQETNKEKISFE